MRIGLLGGTFDPIHLGHLQVATGVVQELQLDGVWFVPAAIPWMKEGKVLATAHHRIEMVTLGIKDEPGFQVCDWEVSSGGYSYTIDTLRRMRDEIGNDHEIFVIIGSDVALRFCEWKQPQEILSLATMVLVIRPGFEESGQGGTIATLSAMGNVMTTNMPVLDIQSRVIRARVRNRESLSGFVPEAVEEYIQINGLYREG